MHVSNTYLWLHSSLHVQRSDMLVTLLGLDAMSPQSSQLACNTATSCSVAAAPTQMLEYNRPTNVRTSVHVNRAVLITFAMYITLIINLWGANLTAVCPTRARIRTHLA